MTTTTFSQALHAPFDRMVDPDIASCNRSLHERLDRAYQAAAPVDRIAVAKAVTWVLDGYESPAGDFDCGAWVDATYQRVHDSIDLIFPKSGVMASPVEIERHEGRNYVTIGGSTWQPTVAETRALEAIGRVGLFQ